MKKQKVVISFNPDPPKKSEIEEKNMELKTVEERTQLYMEKFGMRWRSATDFAHELEHIRTWYDYKDIDRIIDMMMNIAYNEGYNQRQYDMT